jgi:undecaprenol kinase
MTTLHSLISSFKNAGRGLILAFKTERSFRIQLAVALLVFIAVCLLPLQAWERAVLFVAMAAVLVLELVNSMVERLVDLFKPRLNLYVKDIKDLMAAAVLVASFFSALLGFLILFPYLFYVLSRL